MSNYVRDVFCLVDFTDFHQVRKTGVMSASRDTQLAEAEKVNLSIAEFSNKKLMVPKNLNSHPIWNAMPSHVIL